jgi:hypothetical protein
MFVRLRFHRWVIWWLYVGILGGLIAGTNLLANHLTAAQDRILILLGAAHWILGGIVCWAFDGVRVESGEPSQTPPTAAPRDPAQATEYHPASDFLLPGHGHGHNILRWRH